MTTVLVTGATGNVGAAVVRELRARDVATRAFVRDGGKAAARIGEDVELAIGDFSDPGSIEGALAGVDRVFLACGNVPGQVEHERAVIDAAARAGVERIVKLSANGAEPGSPLSFWDWHGRIENHLVHAGLPTVLLRPNNYLSNLFASTEMIAQTDKLFVPAGDARVAMIDPGDVAAVAVASLTEDGHEGHTYVLSGPEALSYSDVAAALSEATGRGVEYVSVTDEEARQGMRQAGIPDFVAEFLVALLGALRAGAQAVPTDTVRAVTGREPRGVAEFVHEHAGAFGGLPTTDGGGR
jgi:uncharacterized protein YbjT (DUF2867 family)